MGETRRLCILCLKNYIFFSIKKRAFVKDEDKEIISNQVPKDLS